MEEIRLFKLSDEKKLGYSDDFYLESSFFKMAICLKNKRLNIAFGEKSSLFIKEKIIEN